MIPIVLCATIIVAYTYAGYPLLVAALARLRGRAPRATRVAAERPTVTACMAVYNGAAALKKKLDSILAQDYAPDRLDVLVFSDGSTDGTDAIVDEYAARTGRVRRLRSETRVGKPTALNRMRAAATGDILLMMDARQPFETHALRELVDALADPEVGCVSGNLVLSGDRGAAAYWRYEKWIRQNEARLGGLLGVTGAIYAVRRADVGELPPDTILDDMWIPMRLRLRRRQVLFCERAVAYDEEFDDEREFARKVRTLAGNYQLLARMPALLLPFVNPSWLELVSHKVLRLVCPFALIALFPATLALALEPGPWQPAMRLLGAAQILFYLAAVVGARAGRLAALCRTFVVLNAAAVVGLWRFMTAQQRITW
jgi:cellulose synthase/poly-beta-1,6-N-acetylglucosamine synthase-like glycosyltransferase